MKLIVGNIVFAAMVWGWYAYVGGAANPAFKPGLVAIFLAFLAGIGIGLWLIHTPKPKALPRKASAAVDSTVFDRIS
jgi:hypothetical protein